MKNKELFESLKIIFHLAISFSTWICDEDDVVSITNSLIFNAQYSFSIFILCVLYFLIKYVVNMKTQSHCKTKMTKFSSTNQIK